VSGENIYVADGGFSGLVIGSAQCDGATPVLLSGFRAEPRGRSVLLSWFTSFETMHDGFNVYRSRGLTNGYERLNRELIRGRSPYTYVDPGVRSETTYYYRLGAVDLRGDEVFVTTSVRTPVWSAHLELLPASPTPFQHRTVLEFALASPSTASLSVYDVAGRKVRELVRGEKLPAGSHTATWDGRNDLGRRVAGGTYFAKLAAGDQVETTKIVYLGGD
jgi:hypothetical protein